MSYVEVVEKCIDKHIIFCYTPFIHSLYAAYKCQMGGYNKV